MELSMLGLERAVHWESSLQGSLLARREKKKKKGLLHICDLKIYFLGMLEIFSVLGG